MTHTEDTIKIRKNNGEVVDFDIRKLRSALERSGATDAEAEAVTQEVKASLYDGITTHRIYQIAYSILRKSSRRTAGRYRLKKAMLEMGPSGYPFEKFVGRLLEMQGYIVQTGQIVPGRCVTHEVDVLARRNKEQLMIECKYHSDEAGKSDVKVSLYIHSRFIDIHEVWKNQPENRGLQFQGMLVTNSRFTDDALQYGTCAGLRMVSWDYPHGDSLKDWIDRTHAHPVTSLVSLKKSEKQALLEKGIVLCRDIASVPGLLDTVVYPSRRIPQVLKEVASIVE